MVCSDLSTLAGFADQGWFCAVIFEVFALDSASVLREIVEFLLMPHRTQNVFLRMKATNTYLMRRMRSLY